MPQPFPHHYELSLEWDADRSGVGSISPQPPPADGSLVEFERGTGVWSPEHLLLASMGMSLMTTFLTLAITERLRVNRYQGRAEGLLDDGPDCPDFKVFTLGIVISVASSDVARAQRLLDRAIKESVILRAVKAPVDIYSRVTGTLQRLAHSRVPLLSAIEPLFRPERRLPAFRIERVGEEWSFQR